MAKNEQKQFLLGGLDSDSSIDKVDPNDYFDMVNMRHDENIEGSFGNPVQIPSTVSAPIPNGMRPSDQDYRVIGYREDRVKNRAIIFYQATKQNVNDLVCHHILEYNFELKEWSVVLMNGPMTGNQDVLNFSADHLILHINIKEDLLFWTDGYEDPRKLNIARAKATMALFFNANATVGSNIIDTTGTSFLSLPAGEYELVIATPRPRKYKVNTFNSNTEISLVLPVSVSGAAVDMALYSGYGFITKDILKAIKGQPNVTPTAEYFTNLNLTVNSLKNKLPQIRYRYIYKDNEISTLSCASERVIIEELLSTTPDQENNGIRIGFNTGSRDVAKVEIFARIGLQDYQSVFTIDKSESPLYCDECYCFVEFYNDGLYNSIDLTDQIKIADDSFPNIAYAQEVVNKNYLTYGNIVQGYDTVSSLNADADFSAVYSGAKSKIVAAKNIEVQNYVHYYYTAGFVRQQVNEINVAGQNYSNSAPGGYAFKGYSDGQAGTPAFNLTLPSSGFGGTLFTDLNTQLASAGYTVYTNENTDAPKIYRSFFVSRGLNVFPKNASGGTYGLSDMDMVYRQYKSGARYQHAIQYFNKEGKRIGGAVTKPGWNSVFPDKFATQGASLNNGTVAGMLFNIRHKPPVDAWTYALCRSQNLSKASYLQWVSAGATVDGDNILLNYSNIFVYQNFNAGQINVAYEPKEGDRIRLIGDASSGDPSVGFTTQWDVPVLLTKKLQDGAVVIDKPYQIRFAKPPFTVPAHTLFEVYTPRNAQDQSEILFYEYGQNLPVLNPGTEGRSHYAGLLGYAFNDATDRGVEYHGDQYIIKRKIPLQGVGSDGSLPGSVTYINVHCEAPFYSDFYDSAYSDNGRAMVIDQFAGRKERPVTIVASRQFVYQTSINGLASIDDTSFEDLDIQYGPIRRLYSDEGQLEIYQQDRCGDMPINQQQLQDNTGANKNLINSSSVLNRVQYNLASQYAIGDHPESFAASYNSRYFVDVKRGAVLRRAADGITCISDYKQAKYFKDKCYGFIEGAGQYIFGAVDKTNQKYLVTFDNTIDGTRAFSEKSNRWTERYTFVPEFYGNINNTLVSFRNGSMVLHDQEDAVGYNSYYGDDPVNGQVDFVFNQDKDPQKSYKTMWVQAGLQLIWRPAEIYTSLGQQSSLMETDFRQKEGTIQAGFLRDINTPNIADPLIYGDTLKGRWLRMTIECLENNQKAELNSVNILYLSK